MIEELRLLILETDAERADSWARTLEQAGRAFRRQRAGSRDEVLGLAAESSFDLVLADCDDSELGGRAALELLRAESPGAAVVFLANSPDEWDLAEEGVELVPKDRLEELDKAVERVLKQKAQAKEDEEGEAVHQESEALFGILFDSAPDVILIIDGATGTLLKVNNAVKTTLGYQKNSLVGEHFSILFPLSANVSPEKLLDHLRAFGSVFDSPGFLRADGVVCPMELTAAVAPWGEKKVIVAILRDITERREAEDALLAEKERLTVTLSSIADGVITVDTEKRITLMNSAAEILVGCSSQAAVGKRIEEIFRLTDPSGRKQANPVEEALTSGHSSGNIHDTRKLSSLRAVDGVQRPVVTAGAPMRNASKTVVGAVLALRDVTRELEIDQMKTDFVSAVSHELQTPLTSINGFVSTLLLDPELPLEERVEFLQIIRNQADRLGQLVEDLLEISQMESRKILIRREPMDLVDQVEKALLSLKPIAEEKKIDLRYEAGVSLPRFLGEAKRVYSVIANLLSNALKFTPEGGWVEVSLAQEGNEIVLQVRDNGLGIPKADLPKIFDKFHRVQRVGLEIPGTGLGLAIAQSIVSRHKGRIDVESAPGEGTTFRVRFPVNLSVEGVEGADEEG